MQVCKYIVCRYCLAVVYPRRRYIYTYSRPHHIYGQFEPKLISTQHLFAQIICLFWVLRHEINLSILSGCHCHHIATLSRRIHNIVNSKWGMYKKKGILKMKQRRLEKRKQIKNSLKEVLPFYQMLLINIVCPENLTCMKYLIYYTDS